MKFFHVATSGTKEKILTINQQKLLNDLLMNSICYETIMLIEMDNSHTLLYFLQFQLRRITCEWITLQMYDTSVEYNLLVYTYAYLVFILFSLLKTAVED